MNITLPHIKPGPYTLPIPVSAAERAHFVRLYESDGAWTLQEGVEALGLERLLTLIDAGYIGVAFTRIGDLLVLLAHGRKAAFGGTNGARSLHRQLDRGYLRLCMRTLRWLPPQPENKWISLEEYDPTGVFKEAHSEHGPVLVAAKLSGDGYSTQHMNRLARKIKSSALNHAFEVVILTPNPRKGRRLAEKQESFLTVLSVRPSNPVPAGLEPVTSTYRSADSGVTPPGPYLAGLAWHDDPQYLHLPARVVRVLQRSRDERIEQATLSLECDGAMSAALLKRYYGLRPEDLKGVLRTPSLIRTTPSQRTSETYVEFLTLSRRLAGKNPATLAHRCATGCARHLMSIGPNQALFKVEFRGRLKKEEPDAVWIQPDGRELAVEFDNGTYSYEKIQQKLTAFAERGFDETIWVVSNAGRQSRLTTDFGDQLRRDILLAEWWT